MSVHKSQLQFDSDEVLSFELFCIEEILKSTCEMYERRCLLFDPLVDNLLAQMDKEADVYSGLDRLLPIRDALQQFELEVKETQLCLTELLANDDDMAQLLISENSLRGSIDLSRHVVVEVLVESYAARLTHTMNNLIYQQQKVKTRQEVAEFSVQMQRNRILRMNLHCAMMGVSIGLCTAVSGMFGMNIDLPNVPSMGTMPYWFNGQFGTIAAFSLLFPSIVYGFSFEYLRGTGFKHVEARRREQKSVLQTLFADLGAVDYAVKESFNAMNPDDDDEEEDIHHINDTRSFTSSARIREDLKSERLGSTDGVGNRNGEIRSSERHDCHNHIKQFDSSVYKSIESFDQNLNDSDVQAGSMHGVLKEVRRVTREDFANYMRAARGGKEVDARAVNIFFDILDADQDGFLSVKETAIERDDLSKEVGKQEHNPSGPAVEPEMLGEISSNLRKPF